MSLDAKHQQLEDDVSAYLKSTGWIVPKALTYHESFDVLDKNAITRLVDATSLCVRTRADRIAIHLDRRLSVKVEPKTVQQGYVNFACELYPLVIHMLESEIGIKCIYPIRRSDGLERGFIVGPVLDEVSCVFFPVVQSRKMSPELAERLRGKLPQLFPCASISERHSGGSGDPFVIVPAKQLEGWKDWRLVFDEVA